LLILALVTFLCDSFTLEEDGGKFLGNVVTPIPVLLAVIKQDMKHQTQGFGPHMFH